MEEKILQAILEEIKGLRKDTNNRFGSLENKFEGLKTSVEVLQLASNQSRQELTKIREILGEKVIWNNEIITFELKDGTKQYGTIHKGEK